uniref:Uncharacterized protein n=1 Tax=Anguilla anguilla TaxID=7936 RepID=A0A0E9Y2C0_ANGAN
MLYIFEENKYTCCLNSGCECESCGDGWFRSSFKLM